MLIHYKSRRPERQTAAQTISDGKAGYCNAPSREDLSRRSCL
ncbi:hypothetical protein [Neisseria meningitidis]|nr:hypothetical protein [Neisseria meningitidis]